MLKFKTNEDMRNNIKTLVLKDLSISISLIILIYFIASVAVIEGALVLQNYENIFKFISLLSLIIFTIYSTTLFFHFITNDRFYGKQVPSSSSSISNRKLILSKVLAIFGFITISMIICTVIPITIFTITEGFIQITPDKLSLNVIMLAVSNIIILSPIAGMIGFVGMRIGFKRKSISVSIFTAFICVVFIGHIFANAYDNLLIRILMLLFVMFIGLVALRNSIKKSLI